MRFVLRYRNSNRSNIKTTFKKWGWYVGLTAVLLMTVWVAVAIAYVAIQALREPPRSFQEIFEAHWEMQFPEDMIELYTCRSEESFHGDGIKYAVYQVDPPTVDGFISQFSSQKNEEVEKKIHQLLGSQDLESPVDPAWFPEWESNYKWLGIKRNHNEIFFIVNAAHTRLFVVELML